MSATRPVPRTAPLDFAVADALRASIERNPSLARALAEALRPYLTDQGPDPWLDRKGVARLLGCTPRRVGDLERKGHLHRVAEDGPRRPLYSERDVLGVRDAFRVDDLSTE